MRRIILFIVVFYLIGLGILDTVAYNNRYSRAVWNQTNYQANRVYYEVRVLLDRIGISSTASARP